MKPAPFKYLPALSWEEAVEYLSKYGDEAKILAGGQTLVPAMNFRLLKPEVLVDVNAVTNGDVIRTEQGKLIIGALARHVKFETPVCAGGLETLLPCMSRYIAHAPIRMRGTFAGSLAHADPASEWCTLLAALQGEVVAWGTNGERVIPANDFFLFPLQTSLKPFEIIKEVNLPLLDEKWVCGFQEFSRRAGDFGLALTLACLSIEGGIIKNARIGIGGVAATPFRSGVAEELLVGAEPSNKLFALAAEAAASEIIDPLEDQHATASYRLDLVRALLPRALAEIVTKT
tara:strand:+ start:2919 stop:3782 length:864 start_codon:yes stop_codon:yes gene_type:complete